MWMAFFFYFFMKIALLSPTRGNVCFLGRKGLCQQPSLCIEQQDLTLLRGVFCSNAGVQVLEEGRSSGSRVGGRSEA